MTAAVVAKSVWSGLARRYALLGPPLRPSREHVCLMEDTVSRHAAECRGRDLRALLLGVTPDVVRMNWPRGTSLVAVDSSWDMVRELWPGDVPGLRRVVCGDWLSLPLPNGSCDVVLGDGSVLCLSWPDGLGALGAELRPRLSEGAIVVLRCYIQPAAQERPDQVFDDVFRGAIPTFDLMRLRLAMAMQPNARTGVAVADVYELWRRRTDGRSMPRIPGWEPRILEAIEYYNGADTVYTFPTLAEFRAVMLDLYDEVSVTYLSGPGGELCPMLVLKPRP